MYAVVMALGEGRWLFGGIVEYSGCWRDTWPRSVMDNASDFGSEDCGFESHRGRKGGARGAEGADWKG